MYLSVLNISFTEKSIKEWHSFQGGPLYSRGRSNELWVCLLEKAYAKLNQVKMITCMHAQKYTSEKMYVIACDKANLVSRGSSNELWVCLLEKAYAKLNQV